MPTLNTVYVRLNLFINLTKSKTNIKFYTLAKCALFDNS